jgi:hypothetical protein
MKSDDIYIISGRIKNILAKSDIALSPVGKILINAYTLVLKELQDYAEKIPEPWSRELKDLLISKEGMPEYVIRLSTPREKFMSLYDEVKKKEVEFESVKKALKHYTKEYEALGEEYGISGDELWMRAESASMLDEDCIKIMRLARSIQMCKYLLKKENE